MVKGDGVKGEEVLLAGLAAFGWPLVLGVNIGRRASSHATHTATVGLKRKGMQRIGDDEEKRDYIIILVVKYRASPYCYYLSLYRST